MKSKTKAFAILFTGIALAIGVAVSSGIIRNSFKVDEANAGTTSVTVNGTSFIETDTNQSATISGVTVGGKLKQYATTALWFTSGSGYIYNSTDLGSISKLILNYKSGGSAAAIQRFNFGSSPMTSYLNSGGTTRSVSTGGTNYQETGGVGKGFFNISVSSKNLQLDSLIIEYVSGPSGTLQSLSYSGNPTKTSYYAGESFDSSGMVITAHYDSSDTVVVTNDCTFTPNPLLAGTTDIQVAYNDGSNIVQLLIEDLIQVASRTLTSLQVTSNPTKMNYFVGDTFDPSGMVVAAHYDDESQVGDYKGYTYSPTGALNNLGSQLITITDSVDTLISTSVTIQVNEAPEIEELFISEYIEGGGNNKAVEIFNGTGADVSLSNYKVLVYANGGTSPSSTLTLSGNLGNGLTYVVVNSDSVAGLLALADLTTGSLTHNGNDVIALEKSGTNVDVVGVIGNSADFAKDVTLVRKSSVVSPTTSYDASEWDSHAVDTFTYLGSHTVNVSAPQYELDAIAWGASFISETATGCNEFDQAQLLTAWSGLATSFNALSSDAKNYLTTLTPNELGNDAQHAVARYTYIITKYGEETFDDFMNLDIQSAPSFFEEAKANNNSLTIIITISVIGLTVLLGYYYLNKKKEA